MNTGEGSANLHTRAAAAVAGGADPRAEAAVLVAAMTPNERLWCLDGDLPFWAGLADLARGGYHRRPFPAAEVARLGIPGFHFSDGPRGVVALGRVAVIGGLADHRNLGDGGSSDVWAPSVVTPLAGLRAVLPGVAVVHDDGADPARAAVQRLDPRRRPSGSRRHRATIRDRTSDVG